MAGAAAEEFVGSGLTDPGADGALAGRRARAIGLIARADAGAAKAAFDAFGPLPAFTPLRASETGLVMVRGRQGGTGDGFNLGEMTVTRAAVRLSDGVVGVGYVAGRDKTHAELAALADALVQTAAFADRLEAAVLTPLAAAEAARRDGRARTIAATKVDFFTLVRTRGKA